MQISFFDGSQPLKLNKPIRLIELFAGYGSQALALKYMGVEFEHWRICEWAVKSIQAYKDLHFEADKTDYSAPTLNTCSGGGVNAKIIVEGEKEYVVIDGKKCRVRRLTERERFRLMGVKDADFERIAKNQSNSSLCHLSGDSIVVDVLMAIFGAML